MKKLFIFVWLVICGLFHQIVVAFVDTAGHRYEYAINQLQEFGIVQGRWDGSYAPDQLVSRAEMLKIILLATNVEIIKESESCFEDVYLGDWYQDVVCTAKSLGIVQGVGGSNFLPNQTASLVEGLKMAVLGFGREVPEVISSFRYEKYLNLAHQKGIISKYERYPETQLTRGMMAEIAYQMIQHQKSLPNTSRQSSWCMKAQSTILPDVVVVNWEERHFITKLGNHYQQSKPAKLVFWFHGRTSDNVSVAGYYGLSRAESNAVFVYPLGLPEEGPQRNRRAGGDKVSALRDYALFDEIYAKITQDYCIDLDQVYVVGHSLGGWFTSMLGCARGNLIRGVGIVGGSPMLFPKCAGPVSAIIFHNPWDPLASFAWGEQIRDKILKQNQCWSQTQRFSSSSDMECVEYTQCLPGAGVAFCKYFNGGHARVDGVADMMFRFVASK